MNINKDIYKVTFVAELTFPDYEYYSFKELLERHVLVDMFKGVICEKFSDGSFRLMIVNKLGIWDYFKGAGNKLDDNISEEDIQDFIIYERNKHLRNLTINKLLDI